MAVLEVRRPGQDAASVRVTRRKPVVVGSHDGSDVLVEDAEPIHCRIAWNGEAYEAVAAGDRELSVNGQPTRQQVLTDGDKLRCEDVVLKMHRGSKSGGKSVKKRAERDAAKVEGLCGEEPDDEPAAAAVAAAAFDDPLVDDESFGSQKAATLPPPRESPVEAAADGPADDAGPAREVERDPVQQSIRAKMRGRARRPGQHDALRSPLLYAMAAGVVLLVVTTLVLSLFIRGQSIEETYKAAVAERDAGRFADAEASLAAFVTRHAGHPLAGEARRSLSLTKVDRLVRGASPDWAEGLARLDSTVAEFRDDEDFAALHPEIAERAGLVALGAAADAGRKRDPQLITLSERAERTLGKFSPEAVPPRALLEKVVAARDESRRTMIRLDLRDEFLGRMTDADGAERPLRVIDAFRSMVAADGELALDKETRKLYDAAVASMVAAAKPAEFEPAEVVEPADGGWTVRTIAVVERPVGDAAGEGRMAGVWADETLTAVDRLSGDPMWSRPLAGSFEPVEVEVPDRGRLAFDGRAGALRLLSDADGAVVRSLGLNGPVPARPTVEGATAFVPQGRRLLRVSLTDLRVTAAAEFGQSILARPAYVRSDPPAVIALGHEQIAYLLDAATLEVRDTLVLGHAVGSVIAPPLATAEFAVLPVNEAGAGAELTLLSVRDGKLAVADTLRLPGPVVDPPVIRGRDLYVATAGEAVSVIAVRDEDGGRLAGGPNFSAGGEAGASAAAYLLAESDREFWLAGRRLRRLLVTAEAVRPVGRAVPTGPPTQAPIATSGSVLVASRRGASDAVSLARVEPETMREQWTTHLAAEPIAVLPGDGPTAAVAADGFVVRADFASGGPFVTAAADGLGEAPSSTAVLDDRLAVAVGEELVFVGPAGRTIQKVPLGGRATAPVRAWGRSVVVPTAGKIKVVPPRGQAAPADFWLAEAGAEAPAWTAVEVIDERRLVAADETGTARVLTLAEDPRAYLAETAAAALPEATSLVIAGGGRVVALGPGFASELDPGSLAEISRAELPDALVASATLAGVETLVLLGDESRCALVRAAGGEVAAVGRWDAGSVGPPSVFDGSAVVTLTDRVAVVGGAEWPLPSRAAGPATRSGGRWVVPLENGGVASRPAETTAGAGSAL